MEVLKVIPLGGEPFYAEVCGLSISEVVRRAGGSCLVELVEMSEGEFNAATANAGGDGPDNIKTFRTRARAMVAEARGSVRSLPEGLPDEASTPGQRELQAKHGTPRAFAEACVNAVGEISPDEARAAVGRYVDEWERA